jgi:hypothetical protein
VISFLHVFWLKYYVNLLSLQSVHYEPNYVFWRKNAYEGFSCCAFLSMGVSVTGSLDVAWLFHSRGLKECTEKRMKHESAAGGGALRQKVEEAMS